MRPATLFLLILTITAISCTKTSTPAPDPNAAYQPVYQQYYVVYNRTLHTTRASCSLNMGSDTGASMNAPNDSTILINGQGDFEHYIEYDSIINIDYKLTWLNRVRYNHVSADQVSSIGFSPATPAIMDRDTATTFYWEGAPLAANEKGLLMYTHIATASTRFLNFTDSTITFTKQMLSILAAGQYTFALTRTAYLPLQQADSTAGGEIVIRLQAERSMMMK